MALIYGKESEDLQENRCEAEEVTIFQGGQRAEREGEWCMTDNCRE